MRVSQSVNKLHIHPHLVLHFLDATLQDVRDAELLRDLRQIFRHAFEMLGRSPRDHFQIGDFRQAR